MIRSVIAVNPLTLTIILNVTCVFFTNAVVNMWNSVSGYIVSAIMH